jgi:hypothetical protein
MLTELDRSQNIDRPENLGNQSKICKLVDPLRYCRRVKELDKFLKTLRLNLASHKHLFSRGDPDQVKYADSFLDIWNLHRHRTHRQAKNTDPSKWARNLRAAKDQCLRCFELFANKLQKISGDKNRCLNSATKAMHV